MAYVMLDVKFGMTYMLIGIKFDIKYRICRKKKPIQSTQKVETRVVSDHSPVVLDTSPT